MRGRQQKWEAWGKIPLEKQKVTAHLRDLDVEGKKMLSWS
jgi:hypothetical protein